MCLLCTQYGGFSYITYSYIIIIIIIFIKEMFMTIITFAVEHKTQSIFCNVKDVSRSTKDIFVYGCKIAVKSCVPCGPVIVGSNPIFTWVWSLAWQHDTSACWIHQIDKRLRHVPRTSNAMLACAKRSEDGVRPSCNPRSSYVNIPYQAQQQRYQCMSVKKGF